MTSLAEVSDLEVRMKTVFTDADRDAAESVLDEASEVVREESGNQWVEAPRIVSIIVLRVAERALRNPEGLTSETAGDYSYRRPGVGADGGLYLTNWERKMLRRAADRPQIWTQNLTRGDITTLFVESTLAQ